MGSKWIVEYIRLLSEYIWINEARLVDVENFLTYWLLIYYENVGWEIGSGNMQIVEVTIGKVGI